MRVHFKEGGVKFSNILKGVAQKKKMGGGRRSDRFRIFLWGGGYIKRGEVNISGWS